MENTFARCRFCHARKPFIVSYRTEAGNVVARCKSCGRNQKIANRQADIAKRIAAAKQAFKEKNPDRKTTRKKRRLSRQELIDRYDSIPDDMPKDLAPGLCFAYGRLSLNDVYSVSRDAQKERIDRYYEQALAPLGVKFHPGGYFFDAGLSGAKPMSKRPAGAKLMETLRRGDHLIVSKVDRVYRDLYGALGFMRLLKQRGVHAHFVDVPTMADGAAGSLVYGVLALVAEFERTRISERTKEAFVVRRRNGQAMHRIVGWQKVGMKADAVHIPDPRDREIARVICELKEAGKNWTTIATQIGAAGYLRVTKHGRASGAACKQYYIRAMLNWPKATMSRFPTKWLLHCEEHGLKLLMRLSEQELDLLLRDKQRLREFLGSAWAAAREAEGGEQKAARGWGKLRAANKIP